VGSHACTCFACLCAVVFVSLSMYVLVCALVWPTSVRVCMWGGDSACVCMRVFSKNSNVYLDVPFP